MITLKIDGRLIPEDEANKIADYVFNDDKTKKESKRFIEWIHGKPNSYVAKLDSITWAVESFGIKDPAELSAVDGYIDQENRNVEKLKETLEALRSR